MQRLITLFSGLVLCGALLCRPTCAQTQPDAARKVVNRVAPIYPELASKMHLEGSVKLLVTVAPDGTVKTVVVRGGHPLFLSAAESAAYRWRWAPSKEESKEFIDMQFRPE